MNLNQKGANTAKKTHLFKIGKNDHNPDHWDTLLNTSKVDEENDDLADETVHVLVVGAGQESVHVRRGEQRRLSFLICT